MAYIPKVIMPPEREGQGGPTRQNQLGEWVGFIDNRAAAASQHQLADMAGRQPGVVAQRALSERIHGGPRMVAQFKSISVNKKSPTTNVEWKEGKLKGSSEDVGMGMAAKNLHYGNVDEGELIGSTPRASAQKDLMAQMPTAPKNSSANKFIKGHLLNHNIGGPGLDFNMFPITASANSLHHSFVERGIKNWVNKDKATVDYSVNVEVKNDQSNGSAKAGFVNAVFDCQAKNLATNETVSAQIASEYQAKAVATKGAFTGVAIVDLSTDDHDYPDGCYLGQAYALLKDEDDQAKVDGIVEHEADKAMRKFFGEFEQGDQGAKLIIGEAFNTKAKRFTARQQAALTDIIVDIIDAYVVRNDKSDQSEHEADYPALVKWMKKV